jgi:NAD(P)-dependent dehydrogenase (short-subunit alcohol dehydrogenase family)
MEGAAPTLAYGVSKAGANYFVRKVHFEHAGVVALAVHPGYVASYPLILWKGKKIDWEQMGQDGQWPEFCG